MRMSALRVGASLALTDSLAEGKSKFLAEVERLRDLLHGARAWPGETLFLIDEIFSGTNSADRRAAAEAVVRGLVVAGAIGALSTHDLALAELADTDELGGRNVHMASPDESDPLGFDYKLKAGVNRTTNALAIVRLLGLS
jgi:DNA mismatch repair ATPase MutS